MKYRFVYKNTNEQESLELSKSWCALVSGGIKNKSFRAVVALLIFWLKSGSSWASDAVFTIPEWLVVRAFAFVIEPDSSSTAFTLLGGWVDASGWIAFTFAWLGGGIELGACGAFSALLGDWIEKLSSGGITLNTVVGDFIIPILAL